MRTLTLSKYIIGAAALAYYVGCAPVEFEKVMGNDPCSKNPGSCVVNEQDYNWDYTITTNGGLVDILIVNDNSASMSYEQNKMAERFDSFLQKLEERSVNYRIGVITTDVSTAATSNTAISYDPNHPKSRTLNNNPRGINGNGALQDGKLITIPGLNKKFLSSTDGSSLEQRKAWFANVIKRPETLQCENYLKQFPMGGSAPTEPTFSDNYTANCPSGDERGMFAANLFVKNNPSSFLRPNAAFAIVFLADEDERGGGYEDDSLPLQNFDLPQTLVSTLRANFLNKPLQIHSIITDTVGCQQSQSNQINTYYGVSGSVGKVYRMATESIGGIVGSICAGDYGSQLASIGTNIVDITQEITLKCEQHTNLEVTLSPAQPSISYNVTGAKLKFSSTLPPGVQIRLKYTCPAE